MVDSLGFLKQIANSTTNLIKYNGAIDKEQSLTITIKAANGTPVEFVNTTTRIDMYILHTDASNNVRFTITRVGANNNDLKIIRTVAGSAVPITILAGQSDSYFADGDVLTLEATWAGTTATLVFKKNGVAVGSPIVVTTFALVTGAPAFQIASGSSTGTQTSNFLVTGEVVGPDVTAPTFSTGPTNTVTGSTTASVTYTSNESGTGATVVTSSIAAQPADATFDAAATAITSATLKTDNLTGLATASLLKAWVQIKDAAGNRTTSNVMVLTSHSGYSRVIIGTPNPTVENRLTSSPDITSGDIIDYGDIEGTGTVVVNDDATFDYDSDVTGFNYYVGNLTDGWGTSEVQTLNTFAIIISPDSGYNIGDIIRIVLENRGFSGSLPDMLKAWLQANGGVGTTIQDCEKAYLTARGVTFISLADGWRSYFTSKGYTGSIQDMQKQYWIDGAPL